MGQSENLKMRSLCLHRYEHHFHVPSSDVFDLYIYVLPLMMMILTDVTGACGGFLFACAK